MPDATKPSPAPGTTILLEVEPGSFGSQVRNLSALEAGRAGPLRVVALVRASAEGFTSPTADPTWSLVDAAEGTEAWTRAIALVKTEFVCIVRAGIRMRWDALDVLAGELRKHPEAAGATGDSFLTDRSGQDFTGHLRCGLLHRPAVAGKSLFERVGWEAPILLRTDSVSGFVMNDDAAAFPAQALAHRAASVGALRTRREFLFLETFGEGFGPDRHASDPRLPALRSLRAEGEAISERDDGGLDLFVHDAEGPSGRWVNVLTVTFNRLDYTRKTIDGLVATMAFPHGILVVDNASTDGSREYLLEQYRNGVVRKVLLLDRNVGLARGINIGWRHETGSDFLLKLDNDMVFQRRGWLEAVVEASDRVPQAAVLGYNVEPRSYPASLHNGVSLRVKADANVGGGCVFLSNRTRDRFGYFCEDYGLYGEEDGDLGLRVRLEGCLNAYMDDEDVAFHLPSGKAGAIDPRTLKAVDPMETEIDPEYRRWKDDQRANLQKNGGILQRNVTAYHSGQRSRWVPTGEFIGLLGELQVFDDIDRWRFTFHPRDGQVIPAHEEAVESWAQSQGLPPLPVRVAGHGREWIELSKSALSHDGIPGVVVGPGGVSYPGPKDMARSTSTSPRASVAAKVSIVIPVHGHLELTKQCIQAVRATTDARTTEIVVVDDASPDETASWLRAQTSTGELTAVILSSNRGFAYACNAGARAAMGEELIFLNNDTLPKHGWLDALVSPLSDATIGLTGARLLYPEGDIQHAGIRLHPNGLPDHEFRHADADDPRVTVSRDRAFVTGACIALSRELFDRMGGFDEGFRMYVEDLDLCLKVWNEGLRVRYVAECVVVHLECRTTPDLEKRTILVKTGMERLFARWNGRWPAGLASLPDWPDNFRPNSESISEPPVVEPRTEANACIDNPQNRCSGGLFVQSAPNLGLLHTLPAQFRDGSFDDPCGEPPTPPSPAVRGPHWESVPVAPKEEIAVHWMAPILNFSGYARLNRDLLCAMDDDGIWPSVTPLDSEQGYVNSLAQTPERISRWQQILARPAKSGVLVCSHLPGGFPEMRRNNPGHGKYVGLTMFETDRLPSGWAQACMAMDEIWVPSRFNRETFAQAGVDPERIQVVPCGIDLSCWDPAARPLEIPGRRRFVLLAVFEWTMRKGWDILLEAFARAFDASEDVCLVLRTRRPANDPKDIRAQIDEFLLAKGIDPKATAPVILLEDPVPDALMPSLYAAVDVVVLPTRGEGWGLPFMEALAMEKPVVATAWGAHTDFLDETVGWMIPVAGLEPVLPEQTRLFPLYGSEHRWARPSLDALVSILKELPACPQEVRTRGSAGRARLAREWTPARSGAWIRGRLEYLSSLPTAVSSASARSGNLSSDGDISNNASSMRNAVDSGVEMTDNVAISAPVIRAGFFDYSGYSRLARDAALELGRQGFVPKIEAYNGDNAFMAELSGNSLLAAEFQAMIDVPETSGIGIAWFPPTEWQNRDVYELFRDWHPRSCRNVGMTMFETDRIPATWARRCNAMDEIWVPSKFNVETFAASGVDRGKLRVIPFGLRISDYDPDNIRPMVLPGKSGFAFLSVFQWSLRKGWDLLLEAFAREFSRDEEVRLVLRTYPSGKNDPPIRERIDRFLEARGLGEMSSRIHLVEEFVSDAQMPALIAGCDAFVLPTRGEGWGIPFMEAMALGKPVIGTRWSGHLDFMNDGNSFLVDIEGLENVADEMREDNELYEADHRWAKPSASHLRTRMREVYEQRERARSVGRQAREDVIRERDLSKTASWIRERCAESATKVATRLVRSLRTVAVDARCLFDRDSTDRGIGHYTHSHLLEIERLAPELRFQFLAPDGADPSLVADHLACGRVEIVPLSRYNPRSVDLLHLPDPMNERPDGLSPFAIPFSGPRTTVFYDLIPVQAYMKSWPKQAVDRYMTRLSQAIQFDGTHLCISRFTREDLVAVGAREKNVGWIGAGLNKAPSVRKLDHNEVDRLLAQLGVRGPYFLQVGALDQHKNFKASLDCFLATRSRVPCQLVVVGRKVHSIGWWTQYVAEAHIPDVIFTDFLPREALEALYSGATSLLFLSQIEGFGFPVLEAMAQGCPVIAYSNSSIPEVGGDAAFLLPNNDQGAVTQAMLAMLGSSELRRAHQEAGLIRSKLFRWEDVAKRTLTEWSYSGEVISGHKEAEPSAGLLGSAEASWAAPVFDPSGYGDEARGFLRELDLQGFSVAARSAGRSSDAFREGMPVSERERFKRMLARPNAGGRPLVISFPAHGFRRFDGFGHHIGRTMFETDGLPSAWVEACNTLDEIWVPSEFNLRTFRDAGVRVPLLKVPAGVDSSRFRPGLDPLPLNVPQRGTTYLSIFEWTHRKAPDVLLAGWAKAFGPGDDVRLVLRTYPPNEIEGDPKAWVQKRIDETLRSIGRSRKDCAPIVVLAKQVRDADMPRLYAAADIYLAPSRGEGWGRPHMEAMSAGVPVIATRWSGNLEFQDDNNSWLIEVDRLAEVGADMEFGFYKGQRWAEPSLDSFVKLLRKSLEDPEERATKARRARSDIEKKWDWKKIAPLAATRLKEIIAGVPAVRSTLCGSRLVPKVAGGRLSGVLAAVASGLKGLPFPSAHASSPHILASEETPDRPATLSIRWEGSQFVHHSLAHVNRELCAGLAKNGHDLSIIPYEPDQFGPGTDPDLKIIEQLTNAPLEAPCLVHVRHQWPPNLVAPKEGRWVVVQPWEFGSPPKEWMPAFCNKVDEIWAYTNYVKDMYVRAGVPEDRVHVVPLGVDCDKFRPGGAPLRSLPPKQGVRFLYVGGSIARKGFDVLLNAWQKAFGSDDQVELLIKDMGGKTTYAGQTGEKFVRQIQKSGRFARIHYLNDDLPPSDLPAIYASADVLVHPYRGEGFGLPIAEAMACGLPVIVTEGGAADDFCSAREGWKIPSKRVLLPGGKVDQMETVDPPWWLEPSEEALIAALREAAANAEIRSSKGASARQRILDGFTWSRALECAEKRLRILATRPIRRSAHSGSRLGDVDLSLEALKAQGSGAAYAAAESQLEDLSQRLLEVEALVARQEFEEADELTVKIVEDHPDRPMAWVTRAIVLRGMKKAGRALEALKRAQDAGGGPETHYEMLALFLQTGKEGPARVQWNILRDKHPAWVERQRAEHREQGAPWLPDRLKASTKGNNAKAGRR